MSEEKPLVLINFDDIEPLSKQESDILETMIARDLAARRSRELEAIEPTRRHLHRHRPR